MKALAFCVILGAIVLLAEANPEPYAPSKINLQSRRTPTSEFSRYRKRSGLTSQLQRRAAEKLAAQNVPLLDYFNGTDLQCVFEILSRHLKLTSIFALFRWYGPITIGTPPQHFTVSS